MIKNLDELAKFVKGGADVLQKAISSEDEFSIELIDGRFVTDTDLDEMKIKVRDEGKKEGQTIGYDFAMKDLKKDFGLEIEGKDRETIAKAIKNNILETAKIEPNKKITELETSLNNLQKQYETDLLTKDNEIGSYKGKLKDISVMSELQRNAPEVSGLKIDQFLTLAKNVFEFDFNDNSELIAKKSGQPIKDKMERHIPVKDILTDFATQNGWFGSPGRGGGNQGGSSNEFKTINDVYRHMEEKGIDPMSAEGEQLVQNFKQN